MPWSFRARPAAIPIAIALIEGLLVLLIHRDDVVPAAVDVLAHVVWTQTIMRAHIFPIALLTAHVGTGADGAFYPPAFHAMGALVATAGGIPAYRAVFYSAVVAGAALPIALYTYTRALLGSARLAAVAVLASLAFEPLPFYALAQGLYPFVVSCLFIPALALALAGGVGQGDRRALALAAGLGVGLFYTHPTEFLTVGLLALVSTVPLLRDRHAWRRAVGATLLVAAAWLIAAAPALAAARRTITGGARAEIQARHDFAALPHIDISALLHAYVYGVYARDIGYLLGLAVAGGVAWCLLRRRHMGLVLAQLALLAVWLDAASLNLLRPFYTLSFPWALDERLAPTHYWVVPPLAALGLAALWRTLRARRLVAPARLVPTGTGPADFCDGRRREPGPEGSWQETDLKRSARGAPLTVPRARRRPVRPFRVRAVPWSFRARPVSQKSVVPAGTAGVSPAPLAALARDNMPAGSRRSQRVRHGGAAGLVNDRRVTYLLGPPRSPRPTVGGESVRRPKPVRRDQSRGDRGDPSEHARSRQSTLAPPDHARALGGARDRALVALLAAPVVILGLLFPLTVTTLHTRAYATARTVVARADASALTWLRRHATPDTLVVNDADPTRPALFDVPIDAGRWMPALGVATPLFGPGGAGPGALDDRLYLVTHIADPTLSPRLARLIARYRARYIYYGAAVPPLAHRHLVLARLLADGRLRLVYNSVTTCGRQRERRGACPTTGAYIFAWR